MSITEHIFGDRPAVRGEAVSLLSKLAGRMGDINEFGLHLPQYRRGGWGTYKEVAGLIDELFMLYGPVVDAVGVEEILLQLKEKDYGWIDWWVNAGPAKSQSEKRDELIMQLIIFCVAEYETTITEFVEANPLISKVARALPSLKFDKYNLVEVDSRFKLEDHGIIYEDKHLIYYHPFLRRYFTANFVDMPAILENLRRGGKITLKLAIDPIHMSEPQHLKRIFEADHWFGPKFSIDKLNDSSTEGSTVHWRNPESRHNLPWKIERTVFSLKNYSIYEKELEIEEINPLDSQAVFDKYALHKYAHAIWNRKTQVFRHLDCAVLAYEKPQHAKRLTYDHKAKGADEPQAKRIKLFRLDGEITLEEAQTILTYFFRYNELIGEYFGNDMAVMT